MAPCTRGDQVSTDANRTVGNWTGIDWGACTATARTRIDPAFFWADIDGFSHLGGEPTQVPVVIELKKRDSVNAATLAQDPAAARMLKIPRIYTDKTAGDLGNTRYFTALARREFFIALAKADPVVHAVARVEIGPAIRPNPGKRAAGIDASWIPQQTRRPSNKPKVVVGIIDDGLPFANGRFRDANGDPLVCDFWDQNPARPGAPSGIMPYGTELQRAQIAGAVDSIALRYGETALYQRLDYRRNLRRGTHGAAVMGLALGPEKDIRETEPAVICVQLPEATIADSSGTSLCYHILDALRYILARADAIDKSIRVVVNLSFGRTAGPHDGSSLIERAMDELIELRNDRLQIVVAAGNNGQSRGHAAFHLGPSARTRDLRWRVLPDDDTPSFMEIWADLSGAGDPPKITVEIVSPNGASARASTYSSAGMVASGAGCVIVARRLGRANPRTMFFVAIGPSSPDAPNPVPGGCWTVKVTSEGKGSVRINAWIQRDDTPYGQIVRGRQSYFDDPEYQSTRFDDAGRAWEIDDPASESYVRRAGTLNALATGKRTVVAGAYRRSDMRETAYSADGQTARAGNIRRPNAMAPAEQSITLGYALSSGTSSSTITGVRGTSAAAPQITRVIAKRLSEGPISAKERSAFLKRDREPYEVSDVTRVNR